LDLTTLRTKYDEPYRQITHQRDWIIELDRQLERCDKQGRQRTAGEVKRALTEFLKRLAQEAAEQPHYASVIAHITKAVRHRWWGLFTCYRISHVPSSNNDLETFFRDLKHHQRRITGRKSVREFILRYGPFAAFIDYTESLDDLLARLRQVRHENFVTARQALRTIETRLKKVYRLRHHPDAYYRDLETRWESAISENRS
jgi:hypothetical protein